jgi:putative transposase
MSSGGLRWGVEPICAVLEIAPSTYYDAKSRRPSARAERDAELRPKLRGLWQRNYSVYGRRKLTKAAKKAGLEVGRDQVARLMRAEGIRGASRSKRRFTTHSDPAAVRAPDLLRRDFTATRPNHKWVADFTYCSTWSGVVYVALVIDVFSGRIVGWKASRSMTAALVVDALNMAAWVRRGVELAGLICHSDAGGQGGLNWSSQHLDGGGVRWGRCGSGSGRCSFIGGRCRRRGGRRWRGERIGPGSGRRSRVGSRPRTRRS